MTEAPDTASPLDEADRVAALHALSILGTPAEDHFEAVCRTARRLFGVADAVITLIDAERQWLQTACRLVPGDLPRSETFCDHTIRSDAVFVVPDARRDPRFADGALLRRSPDIRFYAGAPLILRPGIRVGALCLVDTATRGFSEADAAALKDLAAIVVAHLRLHESNALRAREVEARKARERVIEAQAGDLRARERALVGANRLLTLAEEMTQIGHWRVALGDGQPVWSAGTCRIAGLAPDAPVPALADLAQMYHPDDRERVRETVRAAIFQGRGYEYEARIVRPDGTVRDVAVGGVCETDAAGRAVALFGTVVDVTARKEAAAALARSEARYRELTEALPLLVWTTRTSDGEATYANACFQAYCGSIGSDRLARQDRNHPEDRPRIVAAWEAAVAADAPLEFESRLRRHDGAYRWHKILMIPIRHADGSPTSEWLGTALDIDDIITARQRLEETGNLLRIAQEAADAGAWEWDMRTGLATLAVESVRIYGLPSNEAMALTTAQWTQLLHPDDRTPTWEAVRRAVETRRTYSADYRIVAGAGERWIHAAGRVLYDAQERPYRMVGLHFDVTQRKRAEAALQAAMAAAEAARGEAERASEAKSDFLAAMSHEIRTPLNGILGYADLMIEGRHGPEDRHRLELIRSSGAALLTVVNDILDVSKIEAGQLELDPIVFPLHGLVDGTVSIVRGSALKCPLTVACEFDPALPAFVHGDENRLRQVLLNLLNNAVKFTPAGSVTLRVRREGRASAPTGEAAEAMRFEVVDTGIGIAPAQQDRLFKRFSQVDGSISRRFGGSGLGLAICRHLVTLMGGEIGVESAEGRGSTFWFTLALPARERPALPGAGQAAPVSAACPVADAEGRTEGARLLLVEDVPVNQELARVVLEVRGYRVDVAGDGAEAVAMVAAAGAGSEPYALVLMDVQMPGVDGLTATRRIRALPSPVALVPIVAMTANVLPAQIDDLRAAGMDDHVGKPFKRPELYATIERWLARAERADEATSADAPRAPAVDARVDPEVLDAIRDAMGADRVRALLSLLEIDLGARFASDGAAAASTGEGPAAVPIALDRERLARDAHAVISAAGVLGFTGIAGLCREIETACGEGADVAPLVARLSPMREATIREIRALRAA